MKLTTHNVEQAARGYATYHLACRGYVVQPTDSRFPNEDLLVVSPKGKHFGIDVKGQRTKNFWRMKEPKPSKELFFFLIYLGDERTPRVFIVDSIEMNRLWHEYRTRIIKNGGKEDNIWGVNWTTAFPYENNWEVIPK
ncbi:hypothetical protein ACFL17_08465 [Pseudomonadota bacterium]